MDKDKRQSGEGREVGGYDGSNPIAYYGGSTHFAYTYRKTEKIVTALYMVTSLLSDEEPLKWKARTLGNEMLSFTNTLKDTYATRLDGVVGAIRSRTIELSSLLDIAKSAGLLSEMNASILKAELAGLMGLYAEDKGFAGQGVPFDGSFFAESLPGAYARPARVKDTDDQRRPQPRVPYTKRQSAPRDANGGGEGSDVKKDKRRKAIIELVGKRGNVTIKDVSSVIRDCSEKTIQRELLGLVHEGVLKKEGERRWSRYSLPQA